MVSTDREYQRTRVRRAYELGRFRFGFRSGLFVLPLLVLSLVACHQPVLSLVVGVLLLTIAVTFRWRGKAYGRAVMPGLLAGSAPMMLPLLLRGAGHCCIGGACWSICILSCIGGGLLAGATIGLISATERNHRWMFLASSALIAGLTGMLGCAIVGVAGIAGMLVSVVASSFPVAMVARLRLSSS